MKKLVLLALFATASLSAQNYNHWSIEGDIGATKIRDVTQVEVFNYDLGVRYMANTMFGAKLSANYTNLNNTNVNYQSATLMGIVNAGRVMNFESFTDWWTILAGVGGNYEYNNSNVNSDIYHRLSNFHLAGSIDNEFKLSKGVFLRAGIDIVTGVNSRPFRPIENYTQTTSILNFNAGVTIALGKYKEHADWYIEPKRKDTIMLKPTINNYYTETKTAAIEKPFKEYVQFAYDSFVFTNGSQALAHIKNAAESLKKAQKIYLTGYASPENRTGNINYNKELSEKRAETVKEYLVSLGIDKDNIVIQSEGSLLTADGKNIDLSRSVMIEVK